MKKKIMTSVLAMTMTAMMLSACGQAGSADATATEGNAGEAVPEEASASTESGTVQLKVWGAEEDQELLNTLIEGFKASNSGTTFDITVEYVSESECKDTFLCNIAEAPDVYSFADDQLQAFVAAGAIDPVSEADKVKAANSPESVSASSVNDTLYSYPMTADNGYFMYYDKSVFTDADLQTLDSMMATAAEAGKKVYLDVGNGWYTYTFFANTGLTVGLNDDGISNYCTWNESAGGIAGTDVIQAMIDVCSNPGFTDDSSVGLVDGVAAGTYCAGVSGVWDYEALSEIWGDNLGAVKLPTYTVNGSQIQLGSFAGYKMVGVNAYSSQKEWAHKLADWLTNEESQKTRYSMRKLGPANINAAASEEVQQSVALKALLSQSQYASLQRIGGNYWAPANAIGAFALAGNPNGTDVQEFLDNQVGLITKSNGQ